jgi:hypothetical protein
MYTYKSVRTSRPLGGNLAVLKHSNQKDFRLFKFYSNRVWIIYQVIYLFIYFTTNMLKKPQRVSICQFVQRVEQLNTYIAQLPCWTAAQEPSTV